MDPKITAAINIAMGLVKTGVEIYSMLSGKDNLTDEEIKEIINKENDAQAAAKAELSALLSE